MGRSLGNGFIRRTKRWFADDLVFATLVVGGRTESPWGRGFELDALDVAVKREIEIEAGLLAIGDDIQPCGQLVVKRGDDGIVLNLCAVGRAEFFEVGGGEFKPGGKRIAADDGGAEWIGLHGVLVSDSEILGG